MLGRLARALGWQTPSFSFGGILLGSLLYSLPFVVQALQSAFMAMCQDKAFLEDAAKLGVDMSPLDGDGIQKVLARMAATPKDVIARYNAISGEKK